MIDFMKYKWLYFFISMLVILPGLFSLFRNGLEQSLDFTGGSLLELRINSQEVNEEKLKEILSDAVNVQSVQKSGAKEYIFKTETIDSDKAQVVKQIISDNFGQVEELRFETVGPSIGRETLQKTVNAILLASIAIALYITYRFKQLKYGISALLAMFHDVLVVFGIFSLLGYFLGVEVDTLFVTAVLTILSFSVHDTIVVYDRIRELRRKNPRADFENLINYAITETLGRSVNNSLTIIFMLLALYLLGGETVKWFVFALLVGTISGTYSSPFVASPILILWDKFKKKG